MNATTTCVNYVTVYNSDGGFIYVTAHKAFDLDNNRLQIINLENTGVYKSFETSESWPTADQTVCTTSIPDVEWFLLPHVTMIGLIVMFIIMWIIQSRNQWK